jgi:hypothetical protein
MTNATIKYDFIFILTYSIKMPSFCTGQDFQDSNATFRNIIRDSSDVTSNIRRQGTFRSYQILQGKNLTVPGAVSATDLYDIAFLGGSNGPQSFLISGVNLTAPCVSCIAIPGQTNQLPFNLNLAAALVKAPTAQ